MNSFLYGVLALGLAELIILFGFIFLMRWLSRADDAELKHYLKSRHPDQTH